MLAGGLMAGLAALPLSASADTSAAPQGSATASTVTLKVSLQPLTKALSTVTGATGVDPLAQLASAFETLKGALCPAAAAPVGCDLSIPSSLPNSLTVNIAQANASAVFNDAATDVASGSSSATPVNTDWKALNADISALETELTNFIQGGATQLSQGGLGALTGFLTSSGPGKLSLTSPLGTAEFNILGSVAASLNQTGKANQAEDVANAVKVNVTNDPTGTGALQNALVKVDPFTADALNAATTSPTGVKGPQVSAANTSVGVSLPALLVNTASSANLASLQAELKSLVNALTSAIANPSQAGNILGSVPGVPAQLQGTLSTIGGLVNQTLGTVTSTVPVSGAPIDLTALKAWDTQLSAALDGVNQLAAAIGGLPDVTNLVTSTANIATAKTTPLAAGGVDSTATASLGALDVLPIGGTLSGLLHTLSLPNVTPTTPLISIDGITSTAHAAVGQGTSSPTGSGGLNSIRILGQQIDLDKTLGLTNGTSITKTIGVPGLGANGATGYLTLLISEGQPHTVIDTPTSRAIDMATLDVQLINGCASSCADAITLPGLSGVTAANTAAAPRTASSGGSSNGVQALGSDGDVVRIAVSDTSAAASMNGLPGGTQTNQVESVTSLPKTGMFGGAGIAAGLGLIGVAISLRVIPGLRSRSRRVR